MMDCFHSGFLITETTQTCENLIINVLDASAAGVSQIDPKAKKSRTDSFPKGAKDSHGGSGHNPSFEGYGPIAMLTGQGALAYSLMDRLGR